MCIYEYDEQRLYQAEFQSCHSRQNKMYQSKFIIGLYNIKMFDIHM